MMKKKHVVAVVMGSALEYYDYMLYMHFLVILAPLYLPNDNPEVNALLGFSTFAIGYFARPIGSLIFGHIGDKTGRTKAISLSIVFASLGTFCIGILPTYAQIGFLASILLIICRLVQSFSLGGELPGASCYLIENSTDKNRCLRSSYIGVSSSIAGITAAFLGFLCVQPFMPTWGWRIPFLLVIFLGYIGIHIRRSLEEPEEFRKVIASNKVLKIPLIEVFKKDRLPMACDFCICAGVLAPFVILYGYLPQVIKTNLEVSTAEILLMNSLVMAFSAVFLIGAGLLGDKIGPKKVMLVCGVLFILMAYPIFNIMNSTHSLLTIMMMEVTMALLAAGIAAPLNVVTFFMYPTQRRYTGGSFAWGVGTIVFGGLSPLISKGLVNITNNQSSPAFWLMLCMLMMLIGVKYAPMLKSLSASTYVPREKWLIDVPMNSPNEALGS